MNKFEKVVSESQIEVVIAGTSTFDHFEFLPLDAENDNAFVSAAQCGLQLVGVLTLDKQWVPPIAFSGRAVRSFTKKYCGCLRCIV